MPGRRHVEEPVHEPAPAPEYQERTGDAALGVGAVVLEVDRGRRAVVLAGRMDGRRRPGPDVVGQRLGREMPDRLVPGPLAELGHEEELGRGTDQALGQGLRLGQEEPVVVPGGERPVGALEQRQGGHDVEHGRAGDPVRVIEAQAMGHPAAAIVAGDDEAIEAQTRHQQGHVGRHRPLAVGCVVRRRGRLAAVAVAAQVRADDRERAGECRRHAMPHRLGLRISVQK